MSLRDFEIIQKLGEGAYSQVYKVKRISDSQIYALKKVRFAPLKEKEKNNALNEVRILASISHPNIIAYKEAFVDESSRSLCIIMEFADGGDLLSKIRQHRDQGSRFSENEIWDILIQMVKGVKALHEMSVLHRDLKCANVFICNNGSVKIGDMNVSKVSSGELAYTQTGTPYYASPEVWRDQPYDSKSDIWSLGCVIYEAIMLIPPFRANDMSSLYQKVTKGHYPPISKIYSAYLANTVKDLLQVNPSLRPTCQQILDNPNVHRHLKGDNEEKGDSNVLLRTITLPRNFLNLANKLPAAKYRHISAETERIPGSRYQSPGSFDAKRTGTRDSDFKLPPLFRPKIQSHQPLDQKIQVLRGRIREKVR